MYLLIFILLHNNQKLQESEAEHSC